MSPSRRATFPLFFVSTLLGCNWAIDFVPSQQCGIERATDQRPPPEPLTRQTPATPGETPSFRATAGCTIYIDVYNATSIFDDSVTGPNNPMRMVDQPFEVRVEPLQPEGRIERGVLGYDKAAGGRVTVETSERNTSITLTLFLPNDRLPTGIQEESAVIFLDPPP